MEFPDLRRPLIIAMKGLPCTGKSEIATQIGHWARCRVLYVDDFLDTLSCEKGNDAEFMPSDEEAAHFHRLAFETLCKVAARDLYVTKANNLPSCVIIKSRLSSTFEIDRLIELAQNSKCNVVIIECRIKSEYRFLIRLDNKIEWFGHWEWYKLRNFNDIQKARDGYKFSNEGETQAWDLHLLNLINSPFYDENDYWVKRLVLDLFEDLNLSPRFHLTQLSNTFLDIIKYLIAENEEEDDDKEGGEEEEENKERKSHYLMVQFDELRRSLLEKKLMRALASGKRSQNLCNSDGGCVFKYWETLPYKEKVIENCGVCEEQVIFGTSAYACHFCILTLHKLCAEKLIDSDTRAHVLKELVLFRYTDDILRKDFPLTACRACTEEGRDFSIQCISCVFQMHLKHPRLPTIVNHNCHDHFLALVFGSNLGLCKACGGNAYSFAYACSLCRFYYHISCVFHPQEVLHSHGGYEHVMKLVYSRRDIEQEEAYWCDFCYKDMDPQHWFYSCQACPYYVADMLCVVRFKFV